MGKYCKNYIGKIYQSNGGYTIEVIDGGNRMEHCLVRINGDYIKEVRTAQIKKGKVSYPFHKSVCGVGYLGVGPYEPSQHKKQYTTWNSMFKRCYCSNAKDQHTYADVTVDSIWHNFQVYAEWFDKNYRDGWVLDKDILSIKHKIYSPKTCVFIPPELNAFMTNIKTKNASSQYTGVWKLPGGRWEVAMTVERVSKRVGRFANEEEAAKAYKKARKQRVKSIRKKYKGLVPKKVLKAVK